MKTSEEISRRKAEGIRIVSEEAVESRTSSTLFEHMHLVHNAIPELDFTEIDISIKFLGVKFSAPLLIDCMTGGSDESKKINENLALTAEEQRLPMGVGSQRAGLVADDLIESYAIVRDSAPTAFLIANIGAAQLVKGFSIEDAIKCIKMIKADAFAIHLNPLQELVQPEGDSNYKGVLSKISEFASELNVPIIIKEVGAGLSREVAVKVEKAGVKALNVSGLGGTSWAAVERFRALIQKDELKAKLGDIFWDWGIPTAASLMEVKQSVNIPVIASGGIRNGLEVAKALTLGATICGMASPFLKRALQSKHDVVNFVSETTFILKSAMFVVGACNVHQLQNSRYVLTGPLADWNNSM